MINTIGANIILSKHLTSLLVLWWSLYREFALIRLWFSIDNDRLIAFYFWSVRRIFFFTFLFPLNGEFVFGHMAIASATFPVS